MKLSISSGQRFGLLTVIEEATPILLPSGQQNRAMLCQCDCGKQKIIRLLHLVRGRIQSCGHLVPRHGMSSSKLYNTWRAMKNRCFQDSHINSDRYKKRGIKMHKEWQSFQNFKQWALANGFKDGLTIDRKENDKGYFPDNCRFVSSLINGNNRSITVTVEYRGKKQSLSLLLHEKGIHFHTAAIRGRIKRGWDTDLAIDTPIRNGNYRRR